MCGRYSQTREKEKVQNRFQLTKVPEHLERQFNIAPSQPVQAILNTRPNKLTLVRWGLVPSWAKTIDTRYSMINARAETLLERPAYRGLVRHKRCLIIADSFYEWKKVGNRKEPYRIMLKDEGLFAFAGLWDCWDKDGNELYTCTIITTEANDLVRPIHDRMPVILPAEMERAWLLNDDVNTIMPLLRPMDGDLMTAYRISNAVNSPGNNTEEVANRGFGDTKKV